MNEITTKQTKIVKDLAARIVKEAPKLENLSPEQLDHITRIVIVEGLKDELKREVNNARINYPEEKETFLQHASRTKSEHTRRAYTTALNKLEEWTAKKGMSILEMRLKDADDFIYAVSAEGRASSSTRLIIAGASSFFSFLERRHEHIRNPFRGSKARPIKKAVKTLSIPTEEEIHTIIDSLNGVMKIAVIIMSGRGLRVGALPGLTIWGNRFTSTSKGKEITGELSRDLIKAVHISALDNKQPFKGLTETQIADAFRYVTRKLYRAGKLSGVYSVHDLRHAYAVREYERDKDIYRLKCLLNHASISVTENYLKGLGY